MTRTLLCALPLLLSSAALAQAAAAPAGMFPAERRDRILADGRPLYLRHCATCHGADGDGNGPSARFLSHPPRNFLTGSYEFRMTELGSLPREEDVFRTISLGILGTPMPAWGEVLSYDQRRLLAQYVLALSPRVLTEGPGATLTIPPETPDTAESRARGKELFTTYGCVACHGEQGRGDGPASEALLDEGGHKLRPADFRKGYFQGGRGPAVVFRTISTGLNGTPMPSFAAMMDDAQRWDVAHFVASLAEPRGLLQYLFEDPAGRAEVP